MGNRETTIFSIAKQFSIYPGGRLYGDGPYSGEQFRKECLESMISTGKKIQIILDGTKGYGSSFLEEAFGGLIRGGLARDKFHAIFSFVSKDDPSLIDEIRFDIEEAAKLAPA